MNPDSRAAQSHRLALGVYLALAIATFGPVLTGGRVFSFRDLADYAIPQKLYSVVELGSGRIPLWNPHGFFGFPHLASLQSGVLYPPNLLLLLPFPVGFNIVHVLHFVLAALGMYRLSRAWWECDASAAVISGIAFGFSPYLLSLTDLNAFLFTSSWLPWLLLCGVLLGREATSGRVVATAVAFAMAFLAGEPQTFLIGGLLAVAASAFELGSRSGRWPRSLVRVGLSWGGAAVISLLLVAPALLPFVELISMSERSGGGLTEAEVYQFSLTPGDLGDLVVPGLSGDVVAGTRWRGTQTYVRRPYLSLIILAFAPLGLLGRRRRTLALALGLLAAAGLALALGPDGGLYPVLYGLGYRQSRFPIKLLVLTVLALAALTAPGLERWRDERGSRWHPAVVSLAMLLLVAAAASRGPDTRAWEHGFVVAVLAVLAVAMGNRIERLKPWRLPLIGILLAADVILAARPVLTTTQATGLTASNSLLEEISPPERDPTGCAWPRVLTPVVSAQTLAFVYPDGRFDERSLERKKSLLFGNTNLYFGIPTNRGGESVQIRWVTELNALLDRGPAGRHLFGLAGLGYLVHHRDLGPFGFEQVAELDGVRAFGVGGASPRAFLVGEYEVIAESAARLERLADPQFVGAREAILEREVGVLDHGCPGGSAILTTCRSDRLVLEVDSPGRCLLVMTDTWYPGWRGTIDGAEREVLRVDHAFRGLVLEPGRQQIELSYQPRSFRHGLVLAVAGLFLALGITILGRRRT